MRLDRGIRVFTKYTTRQGIQVWAPESAHDGWTLCTVDKVFDGGENVAARVEREDGVLFVVPLWQLREYRPWLADFGRPDEPVPPTHGAPKGIALVGILTSGDVRGRC